MTILTASQVRFIENTQKISRDGRSKQTKGEPMNTHSTVAITIMLRCTRAPPRKATDSVFLTGGFLLPGCTRQWTVRKIESASLSHWGFSPLYTVGWGGRLSGVFESATKTERRPNRSGIGFSLVTRQALQLGFDWYSQSRAHQMNRSLFTGENFLGFVPRQPRRIKTYHWFVKKRYPGG
jgi:hypothetical protein